MILTTVDAKTLIRAGKRHGLAPRVDYHCHANEAFGQGQFQLSKTISDIVVHISNMEELHSASVSCERSRELTAGILLAGKLQFSLDGKQTILEVKSGQPPLAFAFNLSRPTRWSRTLIEHNYVKKILFCLPHNWLSGRFQSTSNLDQFVRQLMMCHGNDSITQSPADTELLKQYRQFTAYALAGLCEIELEGMALTTIAQILKSLDNGTIRCRQPPDAPSSSAFKISQLIESHIRQSPHKLNLASIADQLGMSVSTAQRVFKKAFQQTIMEYVRIRRLEISYNQLRKKLSIGEVAYHAGYTHATNFSLAFKKHFGVPPGEVHHLQQQN